MRFPMLLTVLLMGLVFSPFIKAAETLFYQNVTPHPFSYRATVLNLGFYEIADDIPFSGSHTVSSFKFKYSASEQVQLIFRFYGVDPATGYPGNLLMEVSREFPAGSGTPTVQLSAAEQFVFTAEPKLKNTTTTGGWFSITTIPLDGNTQRVSPVVFGQANGASSRGFYNLDIGATMTVFDPSGFIPGSFYLQLYEDSGNGSSGTGVTTGTTTDTATGGTMTPDTSPEVLPELDDLDLQSSKVYIGSSTRGTVFLNTAAGQPGFIVKLQSSEPDLVIVPDEITVPGGKDSVDFDIFTTDQLNRDKKTVKITAIANGNEVKAKLKVKR